MTRSLAILALLFSLTVSVPLWAKGDTVLIEVKGETLSTPIKITDPKIEGFTPWAGPGVNGARVPDAEGFIVDWHSGVVTQHAAGLQHYEVSFYAGCRTAPVPRRVSPCTGDNLERRNKGVSR